jgi:hypothetical protein
MDGVKLISQHGLRVIQQPTDQSGLSVIHTARRRQTQQLAHQK